LGHYDRARELEEDFVQRNPNDPGVHRLLAAGHLCLGQLDAARREADTAFVLAPGLFATYLVKGDLAHVSGEFDAAEREYLAVVEKGDDLNRQTARARLARLYIAEGRFEKAAAQMNLSAAALGDRMGQDPAAIAIRMIQAQVDFASGHPESTSRTLEALLHHPALRNRPITAQAVTLYLGISDLARGDIIKAQKTAVDFENQIDKGLDNRARRYHLCLSGAIAMKRGNARTAVPDLEQSVSRLPAQVAMGDEHGFFLGQLAHAYEQAGDFAKARETYEKIIALTTGRLAWGDVYARSYYRLGLIADRQGDKARAREQYQKFVEIWKDADPGLPEVADAGKRLAR
jgi:tetratricopeptide (TPR) repeat protein